MHKQQLICGHIHCNFVSFSLFQILLHSSVYLVNNYSKRAEKMIVGKSALRSLTDCWVLVNLRDDIIQDN